MKTGSWFLCVSVMAIAFNLPAAEERTQTRSVVMSRYGIVASEHPLASQAGVAILEQGGTAIDAAIAANAVMSVVAPMMCGMGGDLFAIVYEAKTGKLHGLNASGWAPAGLNLQVITSHGFTNMPQRGIHSVTVPGAVEGWEKLLKKFGRKSFKQVLAPAIRYAAEGFPITELVASYWTGTTEKLLRGDPSATATFLPGDRPPRVGEIFQNPDLAWSLQQVAKQGAKAFYKGAIARRVVASSQKLGGTLTAEDLARFSARWVDPISTTYRGWTVYEIPPNGQGIAALTMLNLMEHFPLAEYGHNSTRTLHTLIEAKKLAYADMLHYVADPEFATIPVKEILSKKHAAARAKLIDPQRANCKVDASKSFETGTDTTYLCAVDKDGNIISLIQSNYNGFGSGIVGEGTGFALQNRGGLFSLDPSHPNVVAGRKRPLHTIIPGFMEKGDVRIAFGIMGGWNQAQAHAQFVSKLVDHNLNLQAALDTPRFTKLTFTGCDVELETRIPEKTRQELAGLGHELKPGVPFSQSVGGGQAVMRDFGRGINFGASDPRKDGAAVPEHPR